jgi:hypothetical protein
MTPDIAPVDPVGTVTRSERERTLDALCDPAPPPGPLDWNDDGIVKLPGFIPDRLIDRYSECWLRENGGYAIAPKGVAASHAYPRAEGWPDATPYMRHEEIRDLLCWEGLTEKIGDLIGEEPGLHLNLTGWVTTRRDWHQDQYLNEPGVNDAYAAVWVALADIHPDSGPFQYVPGSHRWPQVNRERLKAAMDPEKAASPQWPRWSEELLSPLFEAEIKRRGAEVVTHLPKRGSVLLWHPRLLHRGSKARIPGMERRAVIAHFSGVQTRSKIDMPNYQRHRGQGRYFILNGGPV